MAAKAKAGLGTRLFKQSPPKRTRQGQGQHSRPKPGRKLSRGQGRG
jgi:hypothetical protein